MTDENLQESISTLITESNSGGTGGGAPPPAADTDGMSIEEVLRHEAAQIKEAEKAEKVEKEPEPAKPEKAEKVEAKAPVAEKKPTAETEAAVKEADEEGEAKEVEAEKPDNAAAKESGGVSSEGKPRIPSRLLPREREVWMNTPNPVKSAFERMEREFEQISAEHTEAKQFRESLREYDNMARAANTSIKDALDRYVAVDKLLAQDFGRGIAQIAQSHGKNPVEAVAQFMRAAGVMPQQLGAYLQGQPVQQQPQQQAQQRPQVDPVAHRAIQEVEALKAQLAEQQRQAEIDRTEREMVEPFRQSHPRFSELEQDIVFFLKSDKIPLSLSPVERLEAAYDMAERINPAPIMPQGSLAEPAGNHASDAGKKSVRGAPASGRSSEPDFDDETDLVTLLRKEARKLPA